MLGGGEANLNLKKAGMFPLVHGVRSMALAERIDATSTEARIRALHEVGALDAETAQELTESLHFFMGLRLKAGLDAICSRMRWQPCGAFGPSCDCASGWGRCRDERPIMMGAKAWMGAEAWGRRLHE